MFSHVMIGTNDIQRAQAFYNHTLAVLGINEAIVNKNLTGQTRLIYKQHGSIFMVTEPINGQPSTNANGLTIGFSCNSPEQVKTFHDTAVANGATSIESPPGLRNTSTGKKHLCYFLDPDGHKVCGLYLCE